MAIFNGNKEFSKKRELSQPLVPVPKNVRQAFNIQKAYANGVFQLEPKRKETLYDRCYVFEDINYINKNRTEKKNFLSELMFWLNSMDASYKITLCNEYQSVEKFLASIRNERNEKEYPDIAKGIRQWQESKLAALSDHYLQGRQSGSGKHLFSGIGTYDRGCLCRMGK